MLEESDLGGRAVQRRLEPRAGSEKRERRLDDGANGCKAREARSEEANEEATRGGKRQGAEEIDERDRQERCGNTERLEWSLINSRRREKEAGARTGTSLTHFSFGGTGQLLCRFDGIGTALQDLGVRSFFCFPFFFLPLLSLFLPLSPIFLPSSLFALCFVPFPLHTDLFRSFSYRRNHPVEATVKDKVAATA